MSVYRDNLSAMIFLSLSRNNTVAWYILFAYTHSFCCRS